MNEPIDDTPFGKLVQQIMDAINAFQSEIIAQDVQIGTHNLASRGFYVGGRAPFGVTKMEVQD